MTRLTGNELLLPIPRLRSRPSCGVVVSISSYKTQAGHADVPLVAWFGIPLGIATSLGLSAVALAHGTSTPIITLTADEVSAGLPAVKGMPLSNSFRAFS